MRTASRFHPLHPVSIARDQAASMRMLLNILDVYLTAVAMTTENRNSQIILEEALSQIRETKAPEQIEIAIDLLTEGLK